VYLNCVLIFLLFIIIIVLSLQAKPALCTFRSSKAKDEAFGNFDLDQVARRGVKGQGTYEEAKN
jgi:hypothetical protein